MCNNSLSPILNTIITDALNGLLVINVNSESTCTFSPPGKLIKDGPNKKHNPHLFETHFDEFHPCSVC